MMKKAWLLSAGLLLPGLGAQAQISQPELSKKYSAVAGAGLYLPQVAGQNVVYPDAEYSPEVGKGISYFVSLDYAFTPDLFLGLGFNGSYARGKFIINAKVKGEQLNGYLEAGALDNANFLLNLTYFPQRAGLQPYAKLGLGFFMAELELGDVPLNLTNGVETELFPDYKYRGLGLLPELGLKYNGFTVSVGYGMPLKKLTGEQVSDAGAYGSRGSIRSNSLQVNAAYRVFLF